MAQSTIDIFLNRPRTVLVFLGIWLPPTKFALLYTLYKIVVMLTQYAFILFEIIYVGVVWGDLDEVSEASYLLFTQATVCYKVTVFIVNKKNLRELLDFMKVDIFDPQTSYHNKVLYTNARKVKKLCAVFLVTAIMTVNLWAIMPLFDNAESRFFPFKIWMPVDPQKSPQYQLGYLYQITCIYCSAMLFFAVDSTILSMVMFGCAQLEIIIDKMQKLQTAPLSLNWKPEKYNQVIGENNKLFIECLRHHQAVIRFIEMLEDTYHANIFFQLCATVGIICIIGLRISFAEPSSVQFYSMLNYMATMLSQLYLYCWCGSELTTKSQDLRVWLYQCPWYEQDVKFRLSLLLAMERMKRPIILKAGHYIPLSRPTFVSIVRSSYSYFAVLKQANNK
ncbi:odorant receptor 49b-like [Maniola jurtina]|uniref:odorant receptor 49b-like n=1 Tax=Maniola jurtina TaxID=191418 RepID=UPI001E687258|nr:odorant receptor 49b-like [Maniola jurtina]